MTLRLNTPYRVHLAMKSFRNKCILLILVVAGIYLLRRQSSDRPSPGRLGERKIVRGQRHRDMDQLQPPQPDFIIDDNNPPEKWEDDLEDILSPHGYNLFKKDISKIKIYIYDLASKYNEDVKKCAEENSKRSSMCFDFSNHGFGNVLHVNVPVPNGVKYHDTHQFGLEYIFHQKLLRTLHVTKDPSEADLFYVPFYAGLACFCSEGIGQQLADDFWNVSKDLQFLSSGKTHFMALAKIEQEMSSERCPLLRNTKSGVLKYLVIEQTPWEKTRKYFLREGKEEELVVVPYPSYGHLQRPEADSVVGEEVRSIYIMMAASMKKSQLRKTLKAQLESCERCRYIDISPDECTNHVHKTAPKLISIMRISQFCLQPPGDTLTRKGIYDSIMSGCIPVVFNRDVRYAFQDIFYYDEFTIFIEEDRILHGGETLTDILDNYSKYEIRLMQISLKRVAQFLQYGQYGHGEDAATIAIRSLLY